MSEDFDFTEEMSQYAFTAEGLESLTYVIGEFCHGFNIDEIAANHSLLDADDIKVMLLMLVTGYARAYFEEPVE